MPNDNQLLQPGETLGAPVVATSPNATPEAAPNAAPDSSSLLQPGETLGPQVTQPQTAGDLAAQSSSSADFEQKMAATHIYNPATKRIEMHQNTAANALQGVKDSFLGQMVKDAIAPPQGADEHVVLFAGGGPQALIAYRQAKSLVNSAQNVMKSAKEKFPQAIHDFQRTLKDYHNKDYRNLASDVVSTGADVAGLTPTGVMLPTEQTRELSEGARKGGNLATPLTRQVLDAATALEGGEPVAKVGGEVAESTAQAASEAAGAAKSAVKNAPKNIADKIEEIKPEQLTRRPETPAAQHGTPVKVESPLDGPTVGKQIGGKDLSQEALDKLQQHVGDKIQVGSTAKNKLMESVEPVSDAISQNVKKMNGLVKDAKPFTTSVAQDSVFGEGKLNSDLDAMKKNLPASERAKLGADVDDVLEDANDALNSQDPAFVLEQRRILGNKIDWDSIEKNPSTATEVQNAARARVYKALTDKIHDEIPDTVPIDRELQPNLELRSHQRSKLGERVVQDPHAATAEAQSELKKGRTTVENDLHNAIVEKNIARVNKILKALGLLGLGTVFGEAVK